MMSHAPVGVVLGRNASFCDVQSMFWPGLIWLTWTGIVSFAIRLLDKQVNVNWPLWPARKIPAGPLGATAITWVDPVKLFGLSGRLKVTLGLVDVICKIGATKSLVVVLV